MTRLSADAGPIGHSSTNISFSADRPKPGLVDTELMLRQMRQNSRSTLQHIVNLIAGSQYFGQTPRGIAFAEDLISRICLSAKLSDSLFGSQTLEGIRARLLMLGNGLVRVFSKPTQEIKLEVSVEGRHPIELTDLLLQITHTVVSSIIKHEMRERKSGTIQIQLLTNPDEGTTLTLSNDGIAYPGMAAAGGMLDLLRDLATTQCGVVEHISSGDTQIIVTFPLLGRRYQKPLAVVARSSH